MTKRRERRDQSNELARDDRPYAHLPDDTLVTAFMALLVPYEQDDRRVRTGRDGEDLLFGRTTRDPFTSTHMRAKARKAWAAENERRTEKAAERGTKRQLLEPITLHECRHTYVSLMHAASVPLERIGDYVGHSGTYMTERYRHLVEGQGAKDAAGLDKFLTGAHGGAQAPAGSRKRSG